MARLLAVFGAAFLVMAILFTPLRMALGWLDAGEAGLSAERIDGTVWGGTLHGASYRGLPLGDVRARLDLLAGGLRVESALGEGVIRAGRAGFELTPAAPQARPSGP
ncbi:hypothetical protein [Phenylobacterium sp.]|uniref:hypothetical protein n=1 Tax=Phenylobacterium sp. TaxID=1871053 RepID=UPI002FE2F19C